MTLERKPLTTAANAAFVIGAMAHCLTLVAAAWLVWGDWGGRDGGLLGGASSSSPSVVKGVIIIGAALFLGVRGLRDWAAFIMKARQSGTYVVSADDDHVPLLRTAGIIPLSVPLKSTFNLVAFLVVVGMAIVLLL